MPLENLPTLVEAVQKELGEADAALGTVSTARVAVNAAQAELTTAQDAASTERTEAVQAIDALITALTTERDRLLA